MWSNDLLSIMYTRLKAVAGARILKKYPNLTDLNFTTESKSQTLSKFPTVYISRISGGTTGDTFDRTVNGVNAIFQIEVIHNTSQKIANDVADIISDLMVEMYFKMVGEPVQDNSDPNTKRNVSRYSRVVGHGDTL